MDDFKNLNDEKTELIKKFQQEIHSYTPDWAKIIRTNQTDENLSIYEILDRKTEAFRKRMREMRVSRGMKQQDIAIRMGCSKQYISKIENNITNIPIERLEEISDIFGISIAYLIGLTDDEVHIPGVEEIYFWEYPQSKYEVIKSEVIEKRLINPLQFVGSEKDKLEEKVLNNLKNHYDLLCLMDEILHYENEKKVKFIKIMRFLIKNL